MEREARIIVEKELEEIQALWMGSEWAKQCKSAKHDMRGILVAYIRGQLTCLSSVAEKFYLDDLGERIDKLKEELSG